MALTFLGFLGVLFRDCLGLLGEVLEFLGLLGFLELVVVLGTVFNSYCSRTRWTLYLTPFLGAFSEVLGTFSWNFLGKAAEAPSFSVSSGKASRGVRME